MMFVHNFHHNTKGGVLAERLSGLLMLLMILKLAVLHFGVGQPGRCDTDTIPVQFARPWEWPNCYDREWDMKPIKVQLLVLGSLQCAAAVFLLLFGFRFFRISSAIIGFLGTFLFIYTIILAAGQPHQLNLFDNRTMIGIPMRGSMPAVWISFGVGLGVGVTVGMVLFLVPKVAVIVVTFFAGMTTGIVLYNCTFVYTNWPPSYFVSVAGSGLVFFILWLLVKRGFVIVVISLYAANGIALAVGMFIGQYFPFFIVDFTQDYYYRIPRPPVWVPWCFVAVIVVVTVAGTALQVLFFARGFTFEQVSGSVFPKRGVPQENGFVQSDDLDVPLMGREDEVDPSSNINGNGVRNSMRRSLRDLLGEHEGGSDRRSVKDLIADLKSGMK
jgi:hypothetical protein